MTKNLAFIFLQFSSLIVIIIFNPCIIFEKMTSFTQILNQDLEQGK